MCNCADLPELVCDPSYYNKGFSFEGIKSYPEYFDGIDSDYWVPDLEYCECNSRCKDCGQEWYLECAPEESTFPLFGLKTRGPGYEPSKEEIKDKKETLSLMAHGGTDEFVCRIKECNNNKLKGREFCVEHITFP